MRCYDLHWVACPKENWTGISVSDLSNGTQRGWASTCLFHGEPYYVWNGQSIRISTHRNHVHGGSLGKCENEGDHTNLDLPSTATSNKWSTVQVIWWEATSLPRTIVRLHPENASMPHHTGFSPTTFPCCCCCYAALTTCDRRTTGYSVRGNSQ